MEMVRNQSINPSTLLCERCMQILSHEEAEERYGLTKQDLSEFQQESHVAIAKTLQMVEAAIDYNECEDNSERLQIAKSLIEMNRMTMETKFAELVSNKMSVDHFN